MPDHFPASRAPRPPHHLISSTLIALLIAAGATGPALATGPSTKATSAKPVASPTAKSAANTKTPLAAKRKGKAASVRQQLKSEAEGLALATATVESINETQLNVAMRVLTGSADCEFNERVSVTAVDGQPGHFHVGHKGLRYTMVPEETATGAVRLVDRRAGVVWLQIPVKSMLMNSKQGRRMVDACTQAEQRVAVAAMEGAAASIGIAPTVAAAVAVPPAVSADATSAAAPAATTQVAATPVAIAPATTTPAATVPPLDAPAPASPTATSPSAASPASDTPASATPVSPAASAAS